jgi:hypothetical protein
MTLLPRCEKFDTIRLPGWQDYGYTGPTSERTNSLA